MFNVTTGIILKINSYSPNRNITVLTDNIGIKVVSLSNLQQFQYDYHILDMWTFIVSNDSKDEIWIPYEQQSHFKNLKNNRGILKLIYYFNKIIINSEPKYHNSDTLYFLLNCYQELTSNRSKLEKIYVFLLFHTLSLQGIQFNFKNCINCSCNCNIIDFNPQLGGVICYNCIVSSLLTTNSLALFTTPMKLDSLNNWKVNQKDLKKIIEILEWHCETYSGIPIINIKNIDKQLTKQK